jgi:hypothetical protein
MVRLFEYFPKELKTNVLQAKALELLNKRGKKGENKVEFAFPRVKKLPLETKRNVLSAMTHFFNVKNVNSEDMGIAYKKIIKKAELFEICTMVFISKYENYLSSRESSSIQT